MLLRGKLYCSDVCALFAAFVEDYTSSKKAALQLRDVYSMCRELPGHYIEFAKRLKAMGEDVADSLFIPAVQIEQFCILCRQRVVNARELIFR